MKLYISEKKEVGDEKNEIIYHKFNINLIYKISVPEKEYTTELSPTKLREENIINRWENLCVFDFFFQNNIYNNKNEQNYKKIKNLMPGLHSCRDSTRQDENESVKGTLVSSSAFSTCSRLVSQLLEKCW